MKRFILSFAAGDAMSGAAFVDTQSDGMAPVEAELKDDVYQFHMAHYSILFVITDERVTVMDPSQEFRAKAMRAEKAKLTERPVVMALYSHAHFDHSRGGQKFKDEGAEFVTHVGCTDLLGRDLENRAVQSDVTYEGAEHRIGLGGKIVEMR